MEQYFSEVLPDYDEDRVYASDMKKILQWYNLLIENGFTKFAKESKDDKEATAEAKPEAKSKEEEE